jgi:Tat protein translocase TatB subunit
MESEMLFLMVLALIVLGPRRLPEIGRQLGKALAELRRAKNEFTAQIEDEVRRLEISEQQKKSEQQSPTQQPAAAENLGTSNQIKPPVAPPTGTVSVQTAATAQGELVNTATGSPAE